MNIAQVSPRYHPYIGGVETHVKEISERLVKRDYEIEVLTTDPKGKLSTEEVINDVIVKRFKSWTFNESYYFSKGLWKYLAERSGDYDIVAAHSYHAFPAFHAVQAKKDNKFVFTPHYHGSGHTFFRSLLHVFYKPLGKIIFDKADGIICVSNYEKSLVLKNFNVNDKIVVIPNGINSREFIRLKKETRNDNRTILYVGRLVKYKGVDYLIKALSKLSKNTHLEIVGKGPYKKALLKLISKLSVRDRVIFYPNLSREKLLQKYADADIFVTLSKHEAFGISISEALASGTPCIVANTSALKEWIDNKNCFVVNYPIDINELAYMINKVSKKRLMKALNFLSWDEVTERLIEFYCKV